MPKNQPKYRRSTSEVRGVIILAILCLILLACIYYIKNTPSPTPQTELSKEVKEYLKSPIKKIDINKADSSQLTRLKGIGPSLAHRIVIYRAQNGGFKNIYELDSVKGIGIKTISQFDSLICVDCDE